MTYLIVSLALWPRLALGGPVDEVWLAGVDPYVRHVMAPEQSSDYLNLFAEDAPWTHAARHVRVFKTSTQYFLNGPEEALRRMIKDLARRGISLAFEGLMIPEVSACGQGIEGYSAPQDIRTAAERVQRLGGVIDAVAMDEPLWYGHHYRGPHACASSIEDVARQVAGNVAALHEIFPNARVGDIEPIDFGAPAIWIDEILQFARAYRSATGQPLAFVHADLDWSAAWQAPLEDLTKRLHSEHIAVGVIYNGSPDDATDGDWTAHAERRFEAVEADPAMAPDQAILQTWMLHPAHMLPESQSGTMTNLLLLYARRPTRLQIHDEKDRVTGRLTDELGASIAGARIELSATDSSAVPRLSLRRMEGVVPDNAASAVIGLRMNIECNCSGEGSVRVGPMIYLAGDADAEVVALAPNKGDGEPSGSSGQTFAYKVAGGQSLLVNSRVFAVTPGIDYSLDVPLGADSRAVGTGYVALMFLDRDGKGLGRRKLALTPAEWPLSAVTTDEKGSFAITPPSGPDGEFSAKFDGDATWRGAEAR